MRAADYLIDIGPGAGIHGGEVVAAGTPEEVMANPNSLTGQYLSGKKKIPVPETRRPGNGKSLKVIGAAENNLRHIDVEFPLGTFTVVTGVSGSGKSSLVNEILFKRLGVELNRMKVHPGKCDRIEGNRVSGQGGGHRPEPHRPDAPVQPRHLHRPVQRHPGPVRLHPGGQEPGLRPGAVQLQRPGRPVRGLLRRRCAEDRDALPAGHLRALRGVQGQAVQPGDPGGPLQGQEHRRGAGDDRG